MDCSKCGNKMTVKKTITDYENDETYRHSKCSKCGHEIYTIEFIVEYEGTYKERFEELRSNYYKECKRLRKEREGEK